MPSITFDAAATASCNPGDTGITFNHTCGTLTNGIVVLIFTAPDQGNGATSATYGGIAMTKITPTVDNELAGGQLAMFYLLNPPAGTNSVAASAPSCPAGDLYNAAAISYNNAGIPVTSDIFDIESPATTGNAMTDQNISGSSTDAMVGYGVEEGTLSLTGLPGNGTNYISRGTMSGQNQNGNRNFRGRVEDRLSGLSTSDKATWTAASNGLRFVGAYLRLPLSLGSAGFFMVSD